ncbi:MAG: HNH endonuclease [Alphaproteobacteria bacterium]
MGYVKTGFTPPSKELILAVWLKGIRVEGYDPVFRKDVYGGWMKFDQYGQETEYGWEIDHIVPSSLGGSDDLSNLQPLWWLHNRKKSDRVA